MKEFFEGFNDELTKIAQEKKEEAKAEGPKCPKCNISVGKGDAKCPKCGAALEKAKE